MVRLFPMSNKTGYNWLGPSLIGWLVCNQLILCVPSIICVLYKPNVYGEINQYCSTCQSLLLLCLSWEKVEFRTQVFTIFWINQLMTINQVVNIIYFSMTSQKVFTYLYYPCFVLFEVFPFGFRFQFFEAITNMVQPWWLGGRAVVW